MIDVMSKKTWYFVFSGLVIIPGVVALIIWGLNLGIDFTGGTLVELSFLNKINKEDTLLSLDHNSYTGNYIF